MDLFQACACQVKLRPRYPVLGTLIGSRNTAAITSLACRNTSIFLLPFSRNGTIVTTWKAKKNQPNIGKKTFFFWWDCSYSFAASERRAPALRVENGGQADDRAGAEGVGRQAGLRDGGQVGVGGQTGRRHRSEHAAAAHAHPDAAQRGADHAARPATGRRRRCHQQRTRQSCRESISTELYFFFFCLLFVLSVSRNQETLGIFTKPDFDDYNSSRVIEIEPFSFKNK